MKEMLLRFTNDYINNSFNRYHILISGALLIFFTGFPHIWSIFQPHLINGVGWTTEQASLCFYLYFFSFVIGNIYGGKVLKKTSVKNVVLRGGLIFALGVLLSALMILENPLPLYLSYGLMQGFGQGMIYTTIITAVQKLFPEKMGMATGVIVSSNGLCGLVLTPICRPMLQHKGLSYTFIVIGILILFSLFIFLFFYTVKEDINEANTFKSELFKNSNYWLLTTIMLLGVVSYFFVSPISQTYQIGLGIDENIAVLSVMLGSCANTFLRLMMPIIFDRIGPFKTMILTFGLLIGSLSLLIINNINLVTIAIILIYGVYGAIMGCFPVISRKLYGSDNSAENYGYVMLGLLGASYLAPIITSIFNNIGLKQNSIFIFAITLAIIGLLLANILSKKIKGEEKNESIRKNN